MSQPARPNPSSGVLETLLVAAGEPIELDRHLARLEKSALELYGLALPARLAGEAAVRAERTELGRLRIAAAPAAGGLDVRLELEDVDPGDVFPANERGAELRGFRLPGGLGAHKWADRDLLPDLPEGALPLLLESESEVLEAARANVFAVLGSALVTPPADGRILPGTTRAAVIEAAGEAGIEVIERRLGRGELLAAPEVFLTGSVRGIEPAHLLDGARLAGTGAIGRCLAAALRGRWLARSLAASQRS